MRTPCSFAYWINSTKSGNFVHMFVFKRCFLFHKMFCGFSSTFTGFNKILLFVYNVVTFSGLKSKQIHTLPHLNRFIVIKNSMSIDICSLVEMTECRKKLSVASIFKIWNLAKYPSNTDFIYKGRIQNITMGINIFVIAYSIYFLLLLHRCSMLIQINTIFHNLCRKMGGILPATRKSLYKIVSPFFSFKWFKNFLKC